MVNLKIRTEFHFRNAFGRVELVAERLKELGCTHAGIVDAGTWGHVRWLKALQKAGVKPMFGAEFQLPPNEVDKLRPVYWLLAEDTKKFYNLTTALNKKDADHLELLRGSEGVIRFAGTALYDPELFDYVDVNPASVLQQRKALVLHEQTGKPLVVTCDNAYPAKGDYDAFMAFASRGEKLTPQHILTRQELREALPLLSDEQFEQAMANAEDIAARCANDLPIAPIINYAGDLPALVEEGRKYRLGAGHIPEWTDEHQKRLERELAMIKQKQYESYFLVVSDLVAWSKQHMLVGPGRGSSAGSLVCYLLQITEVDPLVHDLLFERFIDVSRNDLPDIDIDFSDKHRHMVFTYLEEKYGLANVARIGSINTLGARSVIARVSEKMGIPMKDKFDVLDVLIEYSSGDSRYGHSLEDTLTQTEPGKRFAARYPEAEVMFDIEKHASHTGVHAAGVIVCNEPVTDFCTVGNDGVAQLDKPDSEHLGLLKIDALGLRTLGVIEDAGVVDAETLYGLTLDDPKVLKVFNDRHYAGIFQFAGQAQRRVSAEVWVDSFIQVDHITALARPGPLGGGASQKYIARAAGREEVEFRHPSMERYLASTMGVVLYQEQVMRICFEIGKFSWEAVSEIRKAMSGSKGKEYFDRRGDEFVAGATSQGVSKEDALEIWSEICTFGAWGMNKSHTVSYSIISYWCAWMKCYHPLAYWAASLRNAKDEAERYELLREAHGEGIDYIPFDIACSGVDWQAVDGKLVGGFMNLVGFGPAKSATAIEQRRLGKLDPARIEKCDVRFKSLFPMHENWGHVYDDPESVGCSTGSRFDKLDDLPTKGDTLILVKVIKKELRDENETMRVARRNGKRVKGQSLFLDVFVTDDSGVPITLRFDRFKYATIGKQAAEHLKVGDIVMARGYKIENFAMVKAKRVKCLNRPEVFT